MLDAVAAGDVRERTGERRDEEESQRGRELMRR